MHFLIEYDRQKGRLVSMSVFDTAEREQAEDSRLRLELDLNRAGIEHEVVMLEASSEEALRLTHRRYFENLTELVSTPQE